MKNLFKKLFSKSVYRLTIPPALGYQFAINAIRGILYSFEEEKQEERLTHNLYEGWQHHYVECFGCLEFILMDLLELPASFFQEGERKEIALRLDNILTDLEHELAELQSRLPRLRPTLNPKTRKENRR